VIRHAVACTAVALAIAAYGCAAAHHEDPAVLADNATRGVYAADYDKTTENFDAALKLQVTRASIGQLSDQMHALGAYQSLKATSSDPDKGRYDYEATFDKGKMLVQIRMDPNWKIGAYRVTAETAATR
jgi:hypothetical protein